jgi:hypothetical protein
VVAVAAFYAGGEEASGTGGSEVAREAAGRVGAPGHAAGREAPAWPSSPGLEAARRRHGTGRSQTRMGCASE